jgi:hypothetical protein
VDFALSSVDFALPWVDFALPSVDFALPSDHKVTKLSGTPALRHLVVV